MNEGQLDGLLEALFQDVGEAQRQLAAADSQYCRRAYVRAVFASVEAFLFWMKHQALIEHQRFSAGELSMICEENYSVDATGKLLAQPKFIPLDHNFRFVASVYLHRDHLPLAVDWGDSGWADFRTGLKVRHRLTHPKSGRDLEVSDDDLGRIRRGHAFVMAIVLTQFAKALRSVAAIDANRERSDGA